MQIIIAPDSFKGSCSAVEVANSMEKGVKKVFPNAITIKIPIADGGEGTVDAIVMGAKGAYKEAIVKNPFGEPIKALYGILPDGSAVIEMAAASGITCIPKEKLNPMIASTYGTGELIKAALDNGAKKILLGIGGSATNDGGVGMAMALGVSFLNKKGESIGLGGGSLGDIHTIDISGIDERIKDTTFIVACDVTNPLCGKDGATAVYGPQKGAAEEMIKQLDNNLKHYAEVIKNDLGKDILNVPGTGAAGGLGAGLLIFCNAILKSGIKTVLETVQIENYLAKTDLIISGEGKIDSQSLFGKVPIGLAEKAKDYKIPVVAVVGGIGKGIEKIYEAGIDTVTTIVDGPISLEEAMENANCLIETSTERLLRAIKIGMKLNLYKI